MLPLLVLPWDNPILQNHLHTSPLLLPSNSMKISSQLPDACNANASQLVANTPLTLLPHNYFPQMPQFNAPPEAGAKLLHASHLHIGHKHKRLHIFWCLCVHKSEHMCNVHTHVLRHILHRQHLDLHLVLRLTSRSSRNFPTSDKVLPRLPHSDRLV
jgi:hypothetical protein